VCTCILCKLHAWPAFRLDLAHREHRSLAQQVVAVLAAGLNVRLDAQTRRRELLEKRPVINGVNKLPDAATLVRQDRER